jgi:hypothetical protein
MKKREMDIGRNGEGEPETKGREGDGEEEVNKKHLQLAWYRYCKMGAHTGLSLY